MTLDPLSARRRTLMAVISVAAAVALYGFLSTPRISSTPFIQLVVGRIAPIGDSRHVSPHLEALALTHITLQVSLLVSMLRVLIGMSVGVPVGLLTGLAMGWSRTVDFPRPRRPAMRYSLAFLAMKKRIWDALSPDVSNAL